MCDDGEANVNWCYDVKCNNENSKVVYENPWNVNINIVELVDRNFIKILIHDKYISALVDSGADQCTISKEMIEHLVTAATTPRMVSTTTTDNGKQLHSPATSADDKDNSPKSPLCAVGREIILFISTI